MGHIICIFPLMPLLKRLLLYCGKAIGTNYGSVVVWRAIFWWLVYSRMRSRSSALFFFTPWRWAPAVGVDGGEEWKVPLFPWEGQASGMSLWASAEAHHLLCSESLNSMPCGGQAVAPGVRHLTSGLDLPQIGYMIWGKLMNLCEPLFVLST